MTTSVRRVLLVVTSLIGTAVGVWAAFLPREFYDSFPGVGLGPWVAVDGPYNEHLVRDVGALYLGLAVAGFYAAAARAVQASRAVGAAWIVFSIPHLVYHLGHLEGFDALNAAIEIVSLSSTIVLALPLLLPNRLSHTPGGLPDSEQQVPIPTPDPGK